MVLRPDHRRVAGEMNWDKGRLAELPTVGPAEKETFSPAVRAAAGPGPGIMAAAAGVIPQPETPAAEEEGEGLHW